MQPLLKTNHCSKYIIRMCTSDQDAESACTERADATLVSHVAEDGGDVEDVVDDDVAVLYFRPGC